MLFTRIVCCIGFVLAVSAFVQMDVYAQSTDTLAVQLENGTLSDEGLVEDIDVTLHIIDQQDGAVLASGTADIYGRVDFNDIPIIDNASSSTPKLFYFSSTFNLIPCIKKYSIYIIIIFT